MPITTSLDKFRLILGDINTAAPLFNDDEANYFIGQHPTNLLLAVADAADSLALRFAREFDFEANESKRFQLSQKSKAYMLMAARLRIRANSEGNSDGTGGVPTFAFPGPHNWLSDLGGDQTSTRAIDLLS